MLISIITSLSLKHGESKDKTDTFLLKAKTILIQWWWSLRSIAIGENLWCHCVQFWSYDRPEGQGLDELVNDLRTMAKNCKFQLFFSLNDPLMKMKVMGDDDNATLESVIHRIRVYESAKWELDMATTTKTFHNKYTVELLRTEHTFSRCPCHIA